MLEASVHGALGLNGGPAEFLLDGGGEDLPVGAHDVADLLQVGGVVLKVLRDVGGERVLEPRQGNVDGIVFGHDGYNVGRGGNEVAHAPALETERLGEAADYGDVRGEGGFLDGRVETCFGPDKVAVALVEDDEAVQGSSEGEQLLHGSLGQDETAGVTGVANQNGVQLVLLDGLLNVVQVDRQVLVTGNEEDVLLRPDQAGLLDVVGVEGLNKTDAVLALTLQHVHRRNNASSHSTDRQNVILRKINLELILQDVRDGLNVVVLAKTTAISVNGLMLGIRQISTSNLRQLCRRSDLLHTKGVR